MKTWIKTLIAWLENLADEGKQDMSDITGEVVTAAENGVKAVEHVAQEAITDVKSAVEGGVAAPANAAAPSVVSTQGAASVDQVLGKIKDLIDNSQQTVTVWPEITTVAKALYSDVPSVVAKVKQLLEFSQQPVKAFDEIASLAIKLVPG